jgi:hypothetical protein
MSDKQDTKRSQADLELEKEVKKQRKFTLAEAIGQMAGPGAMKGVSPVARKQQAEVEIENWLRQHLTDSDGALQVVLLRRVKESEFLLKGFEQPHVVLAACCEWILGSDYRLKELVRDTDIEWGRVFGEMPRFETEGSPPHPDDPYTVESVRRDLSDLLKQLKGTNR